MEFRDIFGISLIILACLLPIGGYFLIIAPADAQFNRLFAAHETMAHDSATFDKMREQITIIWGTMNETWHPEDFDRIYGVWWYPDQNYENSLQATNDYFDGLVSRLDSTIQEMKEIQTGNKTILQPYNAYYQTQLDAFRNETFDAGGLLWAIRGAWYLAFAPTAYFFWYWIAPIMGAFLVFGSLALFYER